MRPYVIKAAALCLPPPSLTLLLLWASQKDRASEYMAYMPGW